MVKKPKQILIKQSLLKTTQHYDNSLDVFGQREGILGCQGEENNNNEQTDKQHRMSINMRAFSCHYQVTTGKYSVLGQTLNVAFTL